MFSDTQKDELIRIINAKIRKQNSGLIRHFKIAKKIFWAKGDRDTGYRLSNILEFGVSEYLMFSAMLGKYTEGACQEPHRDKVPGWNVYRMSITLKKSPKGGVTNFLHPGPAIKLGRFVFMRPDKVTHEVTKVHEGTRYSFMLTMFTRSL